MTEKQDESTPVVSCDDLLEFAEKIKSMRRIDDKIVYEINTTIPTSSFAKGVNVADRCRKLYEQLKRAHDSRQEIIRRCIEQSQRRVEHLLERRKANVDDNDLLKELRIEQSKLKNFQTELNIEEVIQDQSYKVRERRFRRNQC
ncbi:Cid2 domain containing protein [Trichuris trichiura]|uniref:Protein MIX23 n=1 Tax=Trichuris trichiura TaxID=36087 RepID=A0A077YZI8_TRITR|nr:Cid2 domain containing protein [Trichuris trichiura]